MRKNFFEVEYHENFDYEVYKELIPTLDYYLYVGKDEGQMGFIDALAAGIPTIVTPQGFHLDERAVRKACQSKLESFMVPKYFVFVDELPKGDTGKIKKTGLS